MSTVNKMADEDRSSDNYLQDSESSGYGVFGIIEWPLSKLECIERIGECVGGVGGGGWIWGLWDYRVATEQVGVY